MNQATGKPSPESSQLADDDTIDLRDLFLRLGRGLNQILGLAVVGLVLAGLISLGLSRGQPVATSIRVVFSFPGFERGAYPDKSAFQADDLRAPAVVAEALKRQGLDTSSDFLTMIRGALGVEGVIPPNIVKDRERLRTAGQSVPVYIPDEYVVTLSLARSFPLSSLQRAKLVSELVNVYRENFRRTYGQAPLAFGTAFETLRNADFPEYDLVFNSEMSGIQGYLAQQAENAKSYRSPTTNFTFKDLIDQADLFAQIQLNETLGLIRENGLSRNRAFAVMKMNNYLRVLDEREEHALANEKVVKDLLAEAQARSQSVVLGVKSQTAQQRSDSTVLDQGLVDSLLANDANNFLLRKALDAGLAVKAIQAEKSHLLDLRDNLKTFLQSSTSDQTAALTQAENSAKNLEAKYNKLIDNIRRTQADFAQQQYGNAIQFSDQVRTSGVLRPMAIAGIVGGFLGFALGAGLSLLGVYIGRRNA